MTQREHFTYSFQSVAEREATVFKSIVGLLESRTQALWDHLEQGPADLQVCADAQASAGGRVCVLLSESPQPNEQANTLYLNLPLRAGEVLACLEKAQQLLSQPATPGALGSQTVRLLRWPSREILNRSPHYMRLATALGSRAMNDVQLAQATQVPVETSHEFIDLLVTNGLVKVHESVAVPQVPVNKKPQSQGLFARIRAHLGMASSRSEA